jgi:hypothetical protein
MCQNRTIRFGKPNTSVFSKTSDCAPAQSSSNSVGEPKRGSLVILSEVLLCSRFERRVRQHHCVPRTDAQSLRSMTRKPFPPYFQLENISNIPEILAILQISPSAFLNTTHSPNSFADFTFRPLVFKFYLQLSPWPFNLTL